MCAAPMRQEGGAVDHMTSSCGFGINESVFSEAALSFRLNAVMFRRTFRTERGPALLEVLGVDLHVSFEVMCSREGPPAALAAVGPVSSVDLQVLPQVV